MLAQWKVGGLSCLGVRARCMCCVVVLALMGTLGCKQKATTNKATTRTPTKSGNRTQPAKKCRVTRAAFDVGSGSTKMKVAIVDRCLQRVVKLLFPTKKGEFHKAVEKVPYKKDLAESKKDPKRKPGTLSQTVLSQGVAAFKKLRVLAVAQGATEFVGVATSAFRQASNGKEILATLSHKSGVTVHMISQKVEGLLAYYAVRAMSPNVPYQRLLVWDIGGSSMQMMAQTSQGKGVAKDTFAMYLGHLASVPMARHVMFSIQKKKRGPKVTPNPISKRDAKRAITYVATRGKKEIPSAIVKRAAAGAVYGVGGVHFFSVGGQVKAKGAYTRKALQSAIDARLGKDSKQLARFNRPSDPKRAMRFIDTQLSNLLLVAGFMDALGITKVHTASINLASGLFLAREYWPGKE